MTNLGILRHINYYLEKLGLAFSRKEMEDAYSRFKTDFVINLGTLVNILQIGILIYLSIIDFIVLPNTVLTKATDMIVLGALIILLLIRRKISSVYTYLVVACSNFITIRDGMIIDSVVNDIKDSFILGNLHGIILSCSLLTLKQVKIRIIFHLIVSAFRVATLKYWAFPLIDSALLFLFYVKEANLERKKFQKIYESQENLQNFQSLLSNEFPISMFILNSDMQSQIYLNSTFIKTFQRTPDLELFKNFIIDKEELKHIFHPSNPTIIPENDSNLQDILENLKTLFGNAKETSRKIKVYYSHQIDKAPTQYEIIITKINWKMKSAYAFIIQDISERETLAALKLADEQKDKVIATVSHELRTPINGSLGILTMIKEQIPFNNKTLHELIDNCQNCNRLLLYLVNSILDLSQIRHNTLKLIKRSFFLDEILTELESIYLFQSKLKKVKFEIKKDRNTPSKLYTDKYRLIQVLINLIGNAFKFTFVGKITLRISKDLFDERKIRFSVSDTGIGIKEEDKQKLFRMFGKIEHKNANLNSQGVGLGLTISSQLVKALNDGQSNNEITFESEENKGSTFTFAIPYKEDLSFQNSPSITSRFAVTSREESIQEGIIDPVLPIFNFPMKNIEPTTPARILAVDDNPFNLYILMNYLKKENVEIFEAHNGKECLDIIERHAADNKFFDLIFMDIQMPVLDGFETSRMIQEKIKQKKLKNVPIVALTASSSKEIEEYKRKTGEEVAMCDILEKPLKEGQLKQVFEKYIVRPNRV